MFKKIKIIVIMLFATSIASAYEIDVHTEYDDGSYIKYTVSIPDSYIYQENFNTSWTGLKYEVTNLDAYLALVGKRFTDTTSIVQFSIIESTFDNNTTLNLEGEDNISLSFVYTDNIENILYRYQFSGRIANYSYRYLSEPNSSNFGDYTYAIPAQSYTLVRNTLLSSLDEYTVYSEPGPWRVKVELPKYASPDQNYPWKKSIGNIIYDVRKIDDNGIPAIETTLVSVNLRGKWVSKIKKSGGVDSRLIIEVRHDALYCKLKFFANYEFGNVFVDPGEINCK